MTAEVKHRSFARRYVRASAKAEARGGRDHRRRLLAALTGRVIEVGAGNGLNFAHYPKTVSEVVAVEPDATLRALAESAAGSAPVPITVVAGVADSLPVGDRSCDAAVASLVLCSVPNQARALAEIRRVLKPGGELRFYEHVIARNWLGAALQHVIATFWPRIAGGCHPNRDTAAAISAAGFHIARIERFAFSPARFQPPAPHILGLARVH